MNIFDKKISVAFVIAIAIIFIIVALASLAIANVDKLHLEKITPLRPFILQMQKPRYIQASDCPHPITWDMLDEEPVEKYFDVDNSWWFNMINDYTRLQLKNYMKENNLYIVPKDYEMDTANDFNDCMEILEFEKVSEIVINPPDQSAVDSE